jgi:hypothetical protein
MQNVDRLNSYRRTLAASAARTETGVTSAVSIPDAANAIVFEFDVTAAATEAGDTLDMKIQTMVDGTNWIDVCTFTQVLGNGGAKRYFGKVCAATAQTMFENATSLTAGNVRHILGDTYRCAWAITDASTDNASFTFSVTAIVM